MLVKQSSKLDGPEFRKEWSVLFQIFEDVKPMSIFLSEVKLNVLDFLILAKKHQ